MVDPNTANQSLAISSLQENSGTESMHRQVDVAQRDHAITQQAEFHSLLKEMMQKIAQRRANSTAFAQIMLTFLTAPLLTISTSLQVSMPQNRQTLEQLSSGQQTNRVLLLNIKDKQSALQRDRSSSMWRPFRPASFDNIGEVMRGLYKQGTPLSFYKGNGVRSLHILLFHKINTDFTFRFEKIFGQQWKQLKETPLATEIILSCTVNFLLQPLHVAETRMVMQNRLKNYRIHPSYLDFLRKTTFRDMVRGNLLHLPRNFLVALSGLKLTDEISYFSYYGQTFVSQSFAYPFLTVQRRLESVTATRSLYLRGLNSAHDYPTTFLGILKQMIKEQGTVQGIKSLYKGYSCYMLATMLWMSALPATSEMVLSFMPQQQQIQTGHGFDLDEEED